MVGQQEHPSPMTHFLLRRPLRLLQQQLEENPTAAPSTANASSSTVRRLSLAAIILVPLLLGIILLMCYILYFIRYRQYNDQKRKHHQHQLKDGSIATTTLDHHSDGENGSDSTEADDSLNNEVNHQILQSVEVDTDEIVVMEEHRPVVEVAPSVTSTTMALQQSSRDGMLLRRPSYSQTLEETLQQYSIDDTSTNGGGVNASPYHPSNHDDNGDDDATTTTNGPIDIDDGTSYDSPDDDDDEGVTTTIGRADAHSPIEEILIFSDMEHSSDDNDGDGEDDDDEASLSQRSHDLEPYGRFYKRSGPTGHRWPATVTTSSHAATTSLLSLRSLEPGPYHPPSIVDHSTKSTNEKGPKDDNIAPMTNRPVLRRNASISSNASSSSSLYDNIEEQAWIEFQQQSFDQGDTQIFLYQPHLLPSSALSIPSGNNLLELQPGDRIRTEDEEDIDEYYSKRMDNVRSLDCKNICSSNHHGSLLVTQYDDLLRQRQLWDRIQHLPLSSSQALSSKKPLLPSVTSSSSHLARQKVEL